MNDFDKKIIKMQSKLAYLEYVYGYNCNRATKLRDTLEMYKDVKKMSREEMCEEITYAAGEIAKLKTGYYSCHTGVSNERKLLKVLTEKIKAEKKEVSKNKFKSNPAFDIELGSSEAESGFEIEM